MRVEFRCFKKLLHPTNFLVAPGTAPAILDFTPFWAPPEFALAIFANFAGPRRFDMSVLRYLEGIPDFDQLLARAAIRMLLVVAALNGLDGWEMSEEKWAAEQVIQRVCRPAPTSLPKSPNPPNPLPQGKGESSRK